MDNNLVKDLEPLSGLTVLNSLYLYSNYVSDITPLLGLTKLHMLDLRKNCISDTQQFADIKESIPDINLGSTETTQTPEKCQ